MLARCKQPSPHSSGLLPTQAFSHHSPQLLSEQTMTAFFPTLAPGTQLLIKQVAGGQGCVQ